MEIENSIDKDKNCTFCNFMKESQIISNTTSCLVIWEQHQYTKGHILVILKKHRKDLSDEAIKEKELLEFVKTINEYCVKLKKKMKNEEGESPKRIYVSSLCDGVKHLHAHLIPRYPFTEKEIKEYRDFFKNRDKLDKINKKIEEGNIGGFWYMFIKERDFGGDVNIKGSEEFKKLLEIINK